MSGDFYGGSEHVSKAAEKLSEIFKFEKLNGRIAKGLVMKNCDMARPEQHHLDEFYTKAGESFRSFENAEEVISWVGAEIKGAE